MSSSPSSLHTGSASKTQQPSTLLMEYSYIETAEPFKPRKQPGKFDRSKKQRSVNDSEMSTKPCELCSLF